MPSENTVIINLEPQIHQKHTPNYQQLKLKKKKKECTFVEDMNDSYSV